MNSEAPDVKPNDRPGPFGIAIRWIELLGLYWVVPFLVDFTVRWQGRLLIPALMVAGVVLFVILWFDNRFDRTSLWNVKGFKRGVPRILVTAVLAFVVMFATSWWLTTQEWAPTYGQELLDFADRGWLIVFILVLYPLFSVYPQEIILRTFFFHRYGPLFGNRWGTMVASALTFAWVHVIFVADKGDPLQWIPVYLCVPGGLLFGYTYMTTKSTIASAFEHGLVGNLMWISGLGWYFFAGGAVANG